MKPHISGYLRGRAAAALLILALSTVAMSDHATEAPEQKVVRKLADIEVSPCAA
jgi:uncharacterized tellurite resistance protein B-like protein